LSPDASRVGLPFAPTHRTRSVDFPSIEHRESGRPNPGGIVNQLAVQRQSRPLLPELPQLFNGFPTFAGLASLRSFFDGNLMRLEDETKDGSYEVRAELPGVDPTDDIEVTGAS
jgi:HSP20 family molecular chaperone IbpA